MFSWIKDSRNRAAEAHFIESVPRVLAEYGKLLEKFPAAYIDEAWLPAIRRWIGSRTVSGGDLHLSALFANHNQKKQLC
jgi:hypothetical protein